MDERFEGLFGRRFSRDGRRRRGADPVGDFRERRHARHHGRKLGRFFAHGDLRFLVLKLIADKPRHGYELIKEIEERVAGAYSPSPGVIYPTLTLLEELGWVRAIESEGAKKLYEATAEGKMALEASRATVDAILARMDEVRKARETGDDAPEAETAGPFAPGAVERMPEIKSALAALRGALDDRLAAGPLDEAQVGVIAAAIRAAAQSVARA